MFEGPTRRSMLYSLLFLSRCHLPTALLQPVLFVVLKDVHSPWFLRQAANFLRKGGREREGGGGALQSVLLDRSMAPLPYFSFLASSLDLRAKPQIRIPGIHASASSAAAAGILVVGPEMKENAREGALRPRGLCCTNKEIADLHGHSNS